METQNSDNEFEGGRAVEDKTDLEMNPVMSAHLTNDTVRNLSWKNVTVTVKDRQTKKPIEILSGASGFAEAGQVVALMGPSGSGKTTLLNVLAHRIAASNAKIDGEVLVNGQSMPWKTFRHLSSYVEQEDALIGSLTVRETMDFAARLALPMSISKKERKSRVDGLIDSFGIQGQAHQLVGTPIRKGISGGQKRRLSVASQLITDSKILFLDEPTSGLDSAASFEVMSFVRDIARKHRLIVVASIHQPSTSTYELFDQLMLLSAGKTCYFGPASEAKAYFGSINFSMPVQINPAEFLLDLVNVDFARDSEGSRLQLGGIHSSWAQSTEATKVHARVDRVVENHSGKKVSHAELDRGSKMMIPFTLIHRSFIKSYRDVIAYGIRIAMYIGLAIMMGTVWLRLSTRQEDIQPFINAIFFGSAFMSFMAVAYIPAFLEDRATYVKERANGLYGALSFNIANFLIGLPYLFLISILFSVIAYWLSNFRPDGVAFMTWVMWLFLDLVAAESLVVFVSAIFPIFVVSLALVAFMNGLWMSVGGFLVSPTILNVFWRYVFHYIDYQAYVFQGMMVNEFSKRVYDCGADGYCMYQSPLASQGKIAGTAVLQTYGYKTGETGKWVGIMIGIIAGYRLLGWVALYLRET